MMHFVNYILLAITGSEYLITVSVICNLGLKRYKIYSFILPLDIITETNENNPII